MKDNGLQHDLCSPLLTKCIQKLKLMISVELDSNKENPQKKVFGLKQKSDQPFTSYSNAHKSLAQHHKAHKYHNFMLTVYLKRLISFIVMEVTNC